MSAVSRSRALLVFVLALPLTGCLFRSRKVERTISTAPLQSATQQQLIDYINVQAAKVQKYEAASSDPRFHYGFKIFYRQDIGLMTPLVVLGLAPPPDLIVYQ